LLDFTLSQLRGQKSKKTDLSEDQQVALLLRARRVIQLIVPAPARPASGSARFLTHKPMPCTQLRKHALFRPLGSLYPTAIEWPQDALIGLPKET
jgi:hypothetical protein